MSQIYFVISLSCRKKKEKEMEALFYISAIVVFLFGSFVVTVRGMSNYNKNN
jgi:hypothetical protein